jgi:hypothetical protein
LPIGKYLNRKDFILCSLLGFLCLILFKDIILGGHYLLGNDFVTFYMGMKQFLYDEFHKYLSIPFWNPFIFGGIPFWAHFESTIFYPLDALFWVMSPEKAYGYTVFAHLVLAGIFMYLLCRSLRFRPAGSFIAASVFTFNGFVMGTMHDGQMFRIQAYTWIPLIIFFLNKALTSRTPYFYSTMAGMAWGLQILSGSPQDALYTLIAAGLFLGYHLKPRVGELATNRKILAFGSVLFLIGLGIAAIQIVPASEFVNQSARAKLDSYSLVTLGSYPPQGIVTMAMPNFFGNYISGNYWVSGLPWTIPLYNLYVGVLPILLFFFISYNKAESRKLVIFGASLGIVAYILSLGSHTPIYQLVYYIPGFDKIRAPSKIIILWVFALSLLAGKGMDDLFNRPRSFYRRRINLYLCFVVFFAILDLLFHFERSIVLKLFSPFIMDEAIPNKMDFATNIIVNEFHKFTLLNILILLCLMLWIRNVLKPKLLAVLLCVILLADLGYANWGAARHNDKIYLWMKQKKKDLNEILGKDKDLYRVGSFDHGVGPNIEMYFGYQTVVGYTPLHLLRYNEYFNQYTNNQLPDGSVWFPYGAYKNKILMDLLNMKYEISHADMSINLRKTFLPRAFIVPNYKILNKEKVLDYLIRPDFDPKKMVLFEKKDIESQLSHATSSRPKGESLAKVTLYRPDHIRIVTDSSEPGYLFLSEVFYPGWKAFIDDKPQRILRGNYLYRVIEVPEGKHQVHFVFDPLSIKIGVGVTIFTLFMILNMFLYHSRKSFLFRKRD